MIKHYLIALKLLLLPLFVLSQTEHLPAIETDTFIVYSQSFNADENTPATFQNLKPADFDKINIGQEPSFLLSQLSPSITVYSDAGSTQGYSYLRLRGIDQTRINMTLNGVPLNEPEDQGVYFSNYPDFLNSISSVQIQRGIGLSQNGTASYGGSMQFNSPYLLSDSAQGSAGIGYGSFNSYRAFAEYKSRTLKNKAFYLRASHLHSDGYKRNSGNTSQSLFYSAVIYKHKQNLKLTGFVGHQQNKMAWLGVSDSLIRTDRRFNANTAAEDDRFVQSLTMLQHQYFPDLKTKISTTVFYNYLNGNYDFDYNNPLWSSGDPFLMNFAFRSHYSGIFSNISTRIGKLDLSAGLQGTFYTRKHTGSEPVFGPMYSNDGYKTDASIFARASYNIGKFNLFADVQGRYNRFDFKGANGKMQLNWMFLNPRSGINWQVTKNSSIYYSIGSVGREPTRTDIFGGNDEPLVDSTMQFVTFISNAEFVLDQELGYRSRGNNWQFGANLFLMQFKNEIVLNGQFGPNALALNAAFARSFRSGVEIQGNYEPVKGLLFTNASSFNYSRIRDQGISFSPILTPMFIVNQSVSYSFKGIRLALDARYQSSSYIDFANSEKLDDYLLLNAQLSYIIKGWEFRFMVNNLLNTDYYNQGYVDFDGIPKYFVTAPVNFYGMLLFSF
jgi:iron complex outermembrane receptor protein